MKMLMGSGTERKYDWNGKINNKDVFALENSEHGITELHQSLRRTATFLILIHPERFNWFVRLAITVSDYGRWSFGCRSYQGVRVFLFSIWLYLVFYANCFFLSKIFEIRILSYFFCENKKQPLCTVLERILDGIFIFIGFFFILRI